MKKFLIVVLGLFLLGGCGEKLPSSFQNLKPVSITVVKQGTPVEGIIVSLSNENVPGGVAINAKTDTQGIAKIHTSLGEISRLGVAAGNYKIVLARPVVLPPELEKAKTEMISLPKEKRDEITKKIAAIEKENALPEKVTSAKTSSLTLSVTPENGAEMNIDLAKL